MRTRLSASDQRRACSASRSMARPSIGTSGSALSENSGTAAGCSHPYRLGLGRTADPTSTDWAQPDLAICEPVSRFSRTCLRTTACIRVRKRSFRGRDRRPSRGEKSPVRSLWAEYRDNSPANLRRSRRFLQSLQRRPNLHSAWWWAQSGANPSQPNSLIYRVKTGKTSDFAPSGHFWTAKTRALTDACRINSLNIGTAE